MFGLFFGPQDQTQALHMLGKHFIIESHLHSIYFIFVCYVAQASLELQVLLLHLGLQALITTLR